MPCTCPALGVSLSRNVAPWALPCCSLIPALLRLFPFEAGVLCCMVVSTRRCTCLSTGNVCFSLGTLFTEAFWRSSSFPQVLIFQIHPPVRSPLILPGIPMDGIAMDSCLQLHPPACGASETTGFSYVFMKGYT